MGVLGKRGQWRKSRTQKQRNVGARSPHGPAEAEGGHCGGGCSDPGCPAGFSEAQGPPWASGLQDYPGFSAQMNRLGESLRATRPRLLHVLGTITRVCDSETLRMGQWVPPSIGPSTSRDGATQAVIQTGTLRFLPDIPTEQPPHPEGTSKLC